MTTTTNTTTRNFATLAEFVVSKVECDDLGEKFGDASLEGVTGFVYADSCYIENCNITDARNPLDIKRGKYQLVIERSDWLSDDLTSLESILWAEHYLFDTADVILRTDDGTLDDFVRAICASFAKPVDGDLFGVRFSGKREWSPGEAREIIVNSFTYRSDDDVALPMAERLQLMADRAADDVPESPDAEWKGPVRGSAGEVGPTELARMTADMLSAGACREIARFLSDSAKNDTAISDLERRAMVRAADALETILSWQTPKAVA